MHHRLPSLMAFWPRQGFDHWIQELPPWCFSGHLMALQTYWQPMCHLKLLCSFSIPANQSNSSWSLLELAPQLVPIGSWGLVSWCWHQMLAPMHGLSSLFSLDSYVLPAAFWLSLMYASIRLSHGGLPFEASLPDWQPLHLRILHTSSPNVFEALYGHAFAHSWTIARLSHKLLESLSLLLLLLFCM